MSCDQGVPKVPDVSELLRIYGADSDRERALLLRLVHDGREHGWWESYTEGVQPERHFLDSPSRYTSLDHPETLEVGQVFALETYWPADDGWGAARIEEEMVVTETGCELITKFPAEDLLIAGQRYYTTGGHLPAVV